MKRTTIILSLIFALAIALSVSIPTLAANTDQVSIQGTVPLVLDITTGMADIDFGTFAIDTRAESTPDNVIVRCNQLGWTLSVEETAAGDGNMSSGANILTETLKVKGGDVDDYTGIETAPLLVESGARGVTDTTGIRFAQTVRDTDEPGVYSITVIFTASAE